MAEAWQPKRRRGRCRAVLLAAFCAAASVRLNNSNNNSNNNNNNNNNNSNNNRRRNNFSLSARGLQLQLGTSFVSRAQLPCQGFLAREALHGGILGTSASLQLQQQQPPPWRQLRARVCAGPQIHQVLSPTLDALDTISLETQGSASFPCYCSEANVQACASRCTGSLPAAPPLITAAEQAAAEKAARLKALDALAAGGLLPGQELELVS
ncbi:unnamed protein product, partial [Polarella glacialis]